MSIALLIIDMQKEFIEWKDSKKSLDNALEYINETSDMFRKAGKSVVVIQDEEAGEGIGSEGYGLIEELIVRDTDIRISKLYSNGFWKTDLEVILKDLNVEFLVLCGFAAENCVQFTLNGAVERGFNASLLQFGIASSDKRQVEMIHNKRPVISIEALEYILSGNN
jgi:nicotinamidase-related amidase